MLFLEHFVCSAHERILDAGHETVCYEVITSTVSFDLSRRNHEDGGAIQNLEDRFEETDLLLTFLRPRNMKLNLDANRRCSSGLLR